jgi:2,4-dienoyl-CoA reductase-like NADH-dependent reductase (Old Yellow Enzyme family)
MHSASFLVRGDGGPAQLSRVSGDQHNGKDTAFETVGHAPYSASAIITTSEISRARRLKRDPIPAIEMTHEKIAETVQKFAMAAYRMKMAGMDICLVHGGHGNLISVHEFHVQSQTGRIRRLHGEPRALCH